MTTKIKFWGVRGTIPTPYPSHMEFGGNTSCVELLLGERRLILDAGTGIRSLGHWMQQHGVYDAHLLLSHTHLDHINGFPYFGPVFDTRTRLKIMAGHLWHQGGIQQVLRQHLAEPNFPVPVEKMGASMEFVDFRAGEVLSFGDGIEVRTAPLNHPYGATGYRIDYRGRSVCYVTDTEHVPGTLDRRILDLIEGADIFIYDCTYTDAEFADKVGWGHSTWQEGHRLAAAGKVKSFVIFHHEPDHDDEAMTRIEAEAKALAATTLVAREGMEILLS